MGTKHDTPSRKRNYEIRYRYYPHKWWENNQTYIPRTYWRKKKELVKISAKYGEESKIAIRAIRREANDTYRKMKKQSEITEDELRLAEERIQELTDEHVKRLMK